MELWQLWRYQNWGLCAGQCVQKCSYESRVTRSRNLWQHQPLWELIVPQRAEDEDARPMHCEPLGKSMFIIDSPSAIASHLPSPSEDGGTVSSVLPCTATGYPDWCSIFLPNDIFADLHRHSVILTWHNQWLPHWIRHCKIHTHTHTQTHRLFSIGKPSILKYVAQTFFLMYRQSFGSISLSNLI